MTTVAQALQEAAVLGVDRLDAQLLLAEVLGLGEREARAWLRAHDTDRIDEPQRQRYHALLQRRRAGEPVAYLLGRKEFHGLMLQVGPEVLVPRPDTEVLVEWAVEALEGRTAPRVLDLGTGSGAIALALARARPDAQVSAVDLSTQALEVAMSNATRLGLGLRGLQGSWWQALPEGEAPFDLVVSNPPYIAEGDPHLAALVHEPALALSSGPDGLDAIRTIVAGAARYLHAGAWLLLEHGHDQADAVQALLTQAGFGAVASRHDLAGHRRCTGGQRP
ncbi:peptide chain release factor N(5)-glutamine methyltransferase [Caldimonas caldifontis]|uniref:Release factor glutamine methyltransferase n=1 Tax=Caldimonas caldifontis TaxID=1452508 RepID=A0A2S5SSC9_9BURK|nr:peptide chain release factor N(5)-glutamine methyltransferase [Caldimonas caldifontis]PPE65609.1 peptide chain release factor N(5)-glutamine methyltransferase [Caldimonas caldifontis]